MNEFYELRENRAEETEQNEDNSDKKLKEKGYKYRTFQKYTGIIFTSLMVFIFPVFLTNRYFNIRHDKLYMFYFFSGILIIVCTVAVLFFGDRSREQKIKKDSVLEYITIVDWSIIVFVLSAIISTIFSENSLSALTGSGGRNNGLILILFYTAVYFIISRIYTANRIVPALLCISASFVAFLGILNQFYWDPFNLYAGLGYNQVLKFISTIGNRNMFSAYLCIVFPVCFLLFIYSKKIHGMIVSGISAIIVFGGMMCSDSDSSILGVTVFFLISFIFFIRSIGRLSRFFMLGAFMLTGCKLIRIFSFFMDDYSMGFSSIQEKLIYGNTYFAIIILLVISFLLMFIHIKYPKYENPKAVLIGAVIVLGIVVGTVFALIIYFSIFDTQTKLTGVLGYFRFNDAWGTHRGFMWIRAFNIFIDMNIIHKLFGSGPDTFGNMMDTLGYNQELLSYKGETTDCAHNVYLNYLVTIGLLGVGSYITAIAATLIRTVKIASKNKYAVIFAGSILCYSVQAIVNIDQPITTPLFIVMLALTESQNRTEKSGENRR